MYLKQWMVLGVMGLLSFKTPHTNRIHNDKNPGKKMPTLLTGAYNAPQAVAKLVDSIYNQMHLSAYGLDRNVFFIAYKGYLHLLSQKHLKKPGIITVCDYSQPSSRKRLYVLDLNVGTLLFNTYVAHGKNSGGTYTSSFSNMNSSHKSSLGFMITDDTYFGSNGYSLRFNGLERGINDQVRNRAIVMHGSYYVNAERAMRGTMMGRSYGCPAVPASEVYEIIETIKGGTCYFAYYPNQWYLNSSAIINAPNFSWPTEVMAANVATHSKVTTK
ncbi:MAG: murein L,D-transpeptidase catalytic domain family protein [Chitinophagaceae bacterium]